MDEIKSRLKKLRLIQLTFVSSVLLFACVAEISGSRTGDWTLNHWFVTGLALWGGLGGLIVRNRLLRRSEKAFATDPFKGLNLWQSAQIVGFAFAESIALWGFVFRRVLGGALWQASLFYAISLLLLFLWTPRMPVTTTSN
jgi:hypothetical protein